MIAILFGGTIFFALGFFASRFHKWKKIKTYVPLFIGLFLIYIPTIGPLSNSKKRIEQLTEIDRNQVKSIVLQPTKYAQSHNMIDHDTVLVDKNLLDEICSSLHKADVTGDGFLKNSEPVCKVQINMIDKTAIVFRVKGGGSTSCLIINTNGESGWHVANLEAKDFGQLLDKYFEISDAQAP